MAKKLSAREKAAKKLGVKVDYSKSASKQGSSNISSKSSKSTGVAKQAVVPADFIGPLAKNQTYGKVYPDNFIGPIKTEDRYESQIKESKKTGNSSSSNSPKKSSSTNTSQRPTAASLLNQPGVSISENTTSTPRKIVSSSGAGSSLSQGLRLSPGSSLSFGDIENLLSNPASMSMNDLNNAFETGGLTPSTSNSSLFRSTRGGTTPNRVSKPVNPFIPSQSFAAPSNPYQELPDDEQVQESVGTVQRPVGMGQFSRGQYGNGSGGYGMRGSFGGGSQGTNNELLQDLFNNIMGISTANAQEIPQQSYSQDYIRSHTSPVPGITSQDAWSMQNGVPTWLQPQSNEPVAETTIQPSGVGGSTVRDIAQQNSQFTPSQMQQGVSRVDNSRMKQPKFEDKQYNQAIKAQKKALDELIKSIKSQYAQSTTEGTQALEKSKQEDLLKLSGLFNFANQDPNSEQRMQYEQRSRNDYAGQLADFLAKLSQGQSRDISSANQGYQSSLADIMQQQVQAQQAYRNQMQDEEDRMWDRQYKMAQLNKPRVANPKNMSLKAIGFDKFGKKIGGLTKRQEIFMNRVIFNIK